MQATVMVRLTNGALRLCDQCLGDINRKNPKTQKLRNALKQIQELYAYHAGLRRLVDEALQE